MSLSLSAALAPSDTKSDHHWAALGVVCAAALIINVDNTILNVALPTLVRELHATSSQLQWIVDSYAMVFAGLLLVSGSLADRFGRKKSFLIGLAVFGVGSIGAAFSGSVDLLIPFRAVMGIGAALTIPASLSIVNDVFRDPRERARAIGVWGGIIGLGIAIGPIAGGLLLARFWWGSVFLVNVPIVIAGFIGALVLVPDSKNPAAGRSDLTGVLLSITGLGLLLWAIIEGPTQGWASVDVLGTGLLSLMVIAAFVVWELHSRHPMLKLELFRDRRFSIAAGAECLGVFGLLGALFVMTQFLQFDLSFSPLQAGLRILPMAAVLVVCAVFSPVLARNIGTKLTVAGALAAVAGGLWQISAASTSTTSYGRVLPGLLLIGLGAGLLLPTATNSVVGSVPQGDSGIGSAINTMALQVGGRDRRGSNRKRAGNSLPEPHERCPRRAAPSARRHPYDPRLVRWCTGSCRQRRRYEGRTVGACCTRGVHERVGGLLSSRCRCRARRCRHRARLATFACATRRTRRTTSRGRSFGDTRRRTISPGIRGNVPAGLGFPKWYFVYEIVRCVHPVRPSGRAPSWRVRPHGPTRRGQATSRAGERSARMNVPSLRHRFEFDWPEDLLNRNTTMWGRTWGNK